MIISKKKYAEDMCSNYARGEKHGKIDGRLEILSEQSERARVADVAREKQKQMEEYIIHAATASLGTYGERIDNTYTCKRCGVVHKPRSSTLWQDGPVTAGNVGARIYGEIRTDPFKPDVDMLLQPVTCIDFCPRCEVEMNEKRDMLAWALNNIDEVARIKKLADDKEDK